MGTVVLAGATSGSTTLTPTDAVTTVITLPSATCTLAGVGVNLGVTNTNSLSADVTCNNTGSYFTGPTVGQGTSGTWFASGHVTLSDSAATTGTPSTINLKLWDGSTVIDSARVSLYVADYALSFSLSGFLASPAGNLRISANADNSTTVKMRFNASSNSKDSTITAFRIG